MLVMPGLVDCHTHLMEYATIQLHKTYGSAQQMSGICNLLTALKSGITAVGEHHLGHPLLTRYSSEYNESTKPLVLFTNKTKGLYVILIHIYR